MASLFSLFVFQLLLACCTGHSLDALPCSSGACPAKSTHDADAVQLMQKHVNVDSSLGTAARTNVSNHEDTRSLLSPRDSIFGRRRRTNQADGTSCTKDNHCKGKACGRTGRRRGKPKHCCYGHKAKTDAGVLGRWCTNQPENRYCRKGSECKSGLTCRITLCRHAQNENCNYLATEKDTICVVPVAGVDYRCDSDSNCIHKCGRLGDDFMDGGVKYCCPRAGDLQSGRCTNYNNGEECYKDYQCKSGSICSNKNWDFSELDMWKVCIAKRSGGEECTLDNHCSSDKCKNWDRHYNGKKCCPTSNTIFADMAYKCADLEALSGCVKDEQCKSGTCSYILGGDRGYCTECDTNRQCPSGKACKSTSHGGINYNMEDDTVGYCK
mmetsp:Transcript_153503/g.267054  ORF Transcript_153503/g.267054 Transcript_153503/m.267054 type:complete len:382 (-) Transcript_153503:100-1245(-)